MTRRDRCLGEAVAVEAEMGALTFDFLTWVGAGDRTYAAAMAAWRSHCPRFTTGQDALGAGLVEVAHGSGATQSDAVVVLTARGRAWPNSARSRR